MSSVHQAFAPGGRPIPLSSSSSSAQPQALHVHQPQQGAHSADATYPVGPLASHRDGPSPPSPYAAPSGSGARYPSTSALRSDAHVKQEPREGVVSANLFDDDRQSNKLPRIDVNETASANSSPYQSPKLPPRPRQGAVGSMSDITLPPLSSAVPMRRGAVSGESSGPSLPFPPRRMPYNEEDIPSRGPSPTLGRRPSFSMGHSRHIPPGPEVHLPTPALTSAHDRRPILTIPGQHSGSSYNEAPRSAAVRLQSDNGYYYNGANNAAVPRSAAYRQEPNGDDNGYSTMHPSHHHQSAAAPSYGRAEEAYYNHTSHTSPVPYGMPGDGQPRFGQMYSQYGHENGGHMRAMLMGHPHDEQLMAMNGKRPRSAPRVLSSQPRHFACSQCPARFQRNHDLKRHQRGHLSVRPYPCNWCGKSFSRKDALKRHVLVKGCGKERKNGGGGGGSSDDAKGNKRSNSRDNGTDHSRSELDGDDGDDDDESSYMKQDGSDEEDNAGGSSYAHHHKHAASDVRHDAKPSSLNSASSGAFRYNRAPHPTEVSLARWSGPSGSSQYGSTYSSSGTPALGGRLSISGLAGFSLSAAAGATLAAAATALAPPTHRGSIGPADGALIADMNIASSRRPSAVA